MGEKAEPGEENGGTGNMEPGTRKSARAKYGTWKRRIRKDVDYGADSDCPAR
jgi:hypothetical protein